MRHRKSSGNFSRTSSHKKALFYNLSKFLIKYEFIKTTLKKAKELRRFVEPMITLSKNDTLSNRRHVFKKIRDKIIIRKLFLILGKRYINRNGGYLRIVKYKKRVGDGATLAIVELLNE